VDIRVSKIKADVSEWFFAEQTFLDAPIEGRDNRRLDRLQVLNTLRLVDDAVGCSLLYRAKAPYSLGIIS
jgi:hypothetical protein